MNGRKYEQPVLWESNTICYRYRRIKHTTINQTNKSDYKGMSPRTTMIVSFCIEEYEHEYALEHKHKTGRV